MAIHSLFIVWRRARSNGGKPRTCMIQDEVLFDFDLIRTLSGELLSVCGTFQGALCRARLTFIPCSRGDRTVDGIRYRKVTYKRYGVVANCQKVLDLPGEEHFLVHRSNIDKLFA